MIPWFNKRCHQGNWDIMQSYEPVSLLIRKWPENENMVPENVKLTCLADTSNQHVTHLDIQYESTTKAIEKRPEINHIFMENRGSNPLTAPQERSSATRGGAVVVPAQHELPRQQPRRGPQPSLSHDPREAAAAHSAQCVARRAARCGRGSRLSQAQRRVASAAASLGELPTSGGVPVPPRGGGGPAASIAAPDSGRRPYASPGRAPIKAVAASRAGRPWGAPARERRGRCRCSHRVSCSRSWRR